MMVLRRLLRAPLRRPARRVLAPTLTPPAFEANAIAAATRAGAALWYVRQDLVGTWQNSDASGAPAVSSPVGYVADQAGTAHMTQATTANKPTLVQLANGRYALSFDGTDDRLTNAQTTGSAGTYIAAFVPTALALRGVMGNGATPLATAGANLGTTAAGTVRLQRSNGVANTPVQLGGSYSANNPVVASVTWNGATGVVHVGGTQVASGSGPVATSAATLAIGAASAAGTGPWAGTIVAACYAPIEMAANDRIAIERFAAWLSGAPYV